MPALPLQPVRATPSLAATKVAGSHPAIPTAEQWAIRLWNVAAGLLMIAGIVFAFWGGWYWAPLGIAAGVLVEGANRRSAAKVIVNTANYDDHFRQEMLENGIVEEFVPNQAHIDRLTRGATTMYWDGEKLVKELPRKPDSTT